MGAKRISIVIPAYEEGESLRVCAQAVLAVFLDLPYLPEIVFVDDGSTDDTWQVLMELAASDNRIRSVRLSRNFGKEAAICAGLSKAAGDACILMDADLQHPPSAIPEMLQLWSSGGYDIIDGVKRQRQIESLSARVFAQSFYGIVNLLAGLDLNNASDFKLLDRKAVEAYRTMPEHHPFFRGMSSWLGFRRVDMMYDVSDRRTGTGKWPFKSLLKLAINAITSFSTTPLHIVTILGVGFFFGSVILGVQTLCNKFFGHAVDGFSTVIILLLLTGSVIMFCLGVIGVYIAKIYEEVKARPRYIVSETLNG